MKDNDGYIALLLVAIVVVCICAIAHIADTTAHGL